MLVVVVDLFKFYGKDERMMIIGWLYGLVGEFIYVEYDFIYKLGNFDWVVWWVIVVVISVIEIVSFVSDMGFVVGVVEIDIILVFVVC